MSAPRRQAWRDLFRRSPADELGKPKPPKGIETVSAADCGGGASAAAVLPSLLSSQSLRVLRELRGTSAKRMPTLPPLSCHTTSPDSRTTVDFPGNGN